MNQQMLGVLLVASMTVLAGCGAFTSTPSSGTEATTESERATESEPTTEPEPTSTTVTPTPTASKSDTQVTVSGDLPVNATRIWEHTASLVDGTYEPPYVVVVEAGVTPQVPPFESHFGLDEGAETFKDGVPSGTYYPQDGSVYIVLGNGSEVGVERALAHEFAHTILHQAGLFERADARGTTTVRTAIIEGSATYVEDIYTERYLGVSQLDRTCEGYVEGSPYARYIGQPYCFGGRYFAAQLDSPNDLVDPDLRLPNTTEQVLHPRTTDQPANLSVSTETDADWNTLTSFERQGELFVRTILGVEIDEETAREAAEGWGNDRLVHVTGEGEGYVWVLRWDTENDAAEFEDSFEQYLDARGERTPDGWRADGKRYRLSTVDGRTVAVVTGDASFVDAVHITAQDGNKTVSNN